MFLQETEQLTKVHFPKPPMIYGFSLDRDMKIIIEHIDEVPLSRLIYDFKISREDKKVIDLGFQLAEPIFYLLVCFHLIS